MPKAHCAEVLANSIAWVKNYITFKYFVMSFNLAIPPFFLILITPSLLSEGAQKLQSPGPNGSDLLQVLINPTLAVEILQAHIMHRVANSGLGNTSRF